MTSTADSYFVCATPRTGSSLLLGLLESTGVAGRPQAYFREPGEPMWAGRWGLPSTAGYDEYVRAALAAGRTDNGVFGAKLMWGTLDLVVDRLGAVHPGLAGHDVELLERAFGRTRFVYLWRDDVLAQAVSWLRAEQTRLWEADGEAEPGGHAPGYDAAGIEELVERIGEHNAAWERWFASCGVQPHRVRYEDLDADQTGVTRGILAFLGLDLPEGRKIAPSHRRQSDELNAAWIERYSRESARS
ncbi:Stf0 family sulfotransferase [Nonomuraea sp. NPDC005650]|uniref:Stf0 family sulfotransferase n=1 Tax=Nonomuraea sp. NPDC005650 TaxID=3157045 RepID=UPI0033A28213